MFSPKLVNTVFVAVLAFALFTSILAIVKLIPSISVSVSHSGTGDKPVVEDEVLVKSPVGPVYEVSPYILPISWGAVIGTLLWRGRTRSIWSKQGYDYDVFRLVARMRGSPIRVRLLSSLGLPKNKQQLAKELEVDWKTVDNHVGILHRYNLIDEMALVGNSKYYIISEHGKKILTLLSDEENELDNSKADR